MNLAKTSVVLGLHRYGADSPGAHVFRAFHDAVVRELGDAGGRLTHFSAQGKGCSGKLTRINGRAFDKLVQSDFAAISALSLAASPESSDAPAYDHYVYASLGYVDVARELIACLVINESVINAKSPQFQDIVSMLVGLTECDVGYAFSDESANHPEFYVFGMDNGRLSADQRKQLNIWYATPPEDRSTRLRDIHFQNVVNDRQLSAQVSVGVSLKEFIERHPRCNLAQLTDSRRYLWTIADDATLRQLRTQLRSLPIVVH